MIEHHLSEGRLRTASGYGGVVERGRPHPLKSQPLNVDIGDGHLSLARETLGLGHQPTELVD